MLYIEILVVFMFLNFEDLGCVYLVMYVSLCVLDLHIFTH